MSVNQCAFVCRNGYNLFCQEQKSKITGIPLKEIPTFWSRQWKTLSKEQKDEYSRRCSEVREATVSIEVIWQRLCNYD